MKQVTACVVAAILLGSIGLLVSADPYRIGITKIVEHPALDACELGVIDGLTALGYREGIEVEYLKANPQGDMSVATTIAQNFKAEDVDLVVAITTPSAMTVVQEFAGTDTPIVYTAVTAPLAYDIIVSAEDPSLNGNVTGVSDLIDVENDLKLLKALGPGIRRIGLIYNAGEPNAEELKDQTVAAAPGVGVEIVLAVATTSAEVQLAAQSLVGRVDAFFVTTDNTVVSAIDSVVAVAEAANIPFLVADPTSLEFGPVIAAGFDYYALGQATSTVVKQILEGTPPSEIAPIAYCDVEPEEVWLNLDAAETIGLALPQELIDLADGLYYGGLRWRLDQ
jgi:putative ABC transport system substrate-binding protein